MQQLHTLPKPYHDQVQSRMDIDDLTVLPQKIGERSLSFLAWAIKHVIAGEASVNSLVPFLRADIVPNPVGMHG